SCDSLLQVSPLAKALSPRRESMKFSTAAVSATSLAITVWLATAQTKPDTAEAHRAAAKVAAGTDLMGIYDAACPAPGAPGARGGGQRGPGAAPGAAAGAGRGTPRPDPPREQWYAEPVKVFDNLYF